MLSDKILVVDDDQRVIKSVMLTFREYEIIGLQQGEEAVEYMMKPNEINLILLDVFMKGMDGLTVLNEIKKINENVPVIIMTAFGSMDIAVEALRGQADDFIEKPFKTEELREKVKTLLQKKSMFFGRDNRKEDKVERIKRFVERNYTNASLESVAHQICLSPKYVSRMFKNNNSSSFREYKVNVKIEKAKSLLKNSALTINEISYNLGYQNPESFMRLFKRRTKLTPSQYREKVH